MKQATEMPKKVVFFITKASWGGAQKYVFDLATSLPKSMAPEVIYGTHGRLAEELKREGIPTHHLATLSRDVALYSDLRSFIDLWSLLRTIRPDTLHLNSSKAAALGALAGRLAGVPRIIFTAHGWPFKEERGIITRMLIFLVSWVTAILCSATIVVSKEDEKLGMRMSVVRRKIVYIPLALKTKDMLSRQEAAKSLFNSEVEPLSKVKQTRLVTIAELTKNKGLPFALDMLSELEKRRPGAYSYTIIGEGEDYSKLVTQVSEKNIKHLVTFLSFRGDAPEDIRTNASRYLKAFDVFILPSIKEGMPYVLLEAEAAGLPIVTTKIVEQEVHGSSGLKVVPTRDGIALANAVEQITDSNKDESRGAPRTFEQMLSRTQELY